MEKVTLCIVFVTLTKEDLKRPPKFLLQMNILKRKVSKNNVEKPLLNMHWIFICFSSGSTELKTYHLKKKITCGIKWRLMFGFFYLLFFVHLFVFVLWISWKIKCKYSQPTISFSEGHFYAFRDKITAVSRVGRWKMYVVITFEALLLEAACKKT